MESTNQLTQIQSILSAHQSLAIVVASSSLDSISAGISLAASLEKAGKEVSVFCPAISPEVAKDIIGAEKVEKEIEKKDLVIKLDYPLNQIDRVYSTEEGTNLNLIVKTKAGVAPIASGQVKIIPPKSIPEAGFIFGDETTVQGLSQIVAKGTWVWVGDTNFDQNLCPSKTWAKLVLAENAISSSEQIARLIQGMGLPLDRDIARNLYMGIKAGTNSFELVKTYRTFEVAAVCFKLFQNKNGIKVVTENVAGQASCNEEIKPGNIENKEGDLSTSAGFPTPKIFKGSTTPRV